METSQAVATGDTFAAQSFELTRWEKAASVLQRVPIFPLLILATLIFTAVAATSGKALLGQIPWMEAVLVVTGSAIGTLAGARLTRRIPARVLRWVLIAILLVLHHRLHVHD